MEFKKSLFNYEISERSLSLSTAVTFLKCIKNNILIAGIGNYVCVRYYKPSKVLHSMNVKVFESSSVHGCSSLAKDEIINVLIWGQKSIAALTFKNLQNHDASQKWETFLPELHLKDWIVQVKYCVDGKTAWVLSAHNVFSQLDLELGNIVQEIYCSENALHYCGALWGQTLKTCAVLAGTVFGQIYIWTPAFKMKEITNSAIKPVLTLTGMKGAIFSISLNEEKDLIATTSDDRSVCLWRVKFSLNSLKYWSEAEIEKIFCSFGHIARVWNSLILEDGYVVTCGEDSKVCVWSQEGELKQSWKAHGGSSIRSLDSNGKNIFTGGSSGEIREWNFPITSSCMSSYPNYSSVKLLEINKTDGQWKPSKEIARAVGRTHPTSLHSISSRGCHWIWMADKWKFISFNSSLMGYVITAFSKDFMIFGTQQGALEIYSAETMDLLFVQLLGAMKKILSLLIIKDIILTCVDSGIIQVWNINTAPEKSILKLVREYQLPKCKQQSITSAAFLDFFIVVGTRCGSLHLFKREIRDPVYSLKRIHGKNGVTSINSCEDKLLSCGRDGHIRFSKVVDDTLVITLCIKVPMGDWICGILRLDNVMIVPIFKGEKLEFWNLSEEILVCSIACGGGHRCWDLFLNETKFQTSGQLLDSMSGECASISMTFLKDGQVFECNVELQNIVPTLQSAVCTSEIRSAQVVWVGEEKIILACGGEDTLLHFNLIEDETINKVKSIKSHLSSIKSLTLVETIGANVVKPRNEEYLVSCGGRAQLKIWKLVLSSDGEEILGSKERLSKSVDSPFHPLITDKVLASHMLKSGPEKHWKSEALDFDPETRYMDCLALWISPEAILMIMASSDGFLRIFVFSTSTNCIDLLYEENCEFCLLKLCLLELNEEILVLAADTRGNITGWNLKNCIDCCAICIPNDEDEREVSLEKVSYTVETCGLNCMDSTSRLLKEGDSRAEAFVATGGDSGSLSVVQASLDSNSTALKFKVGCSSSRHAAQVSGVSWLNDHLLLSASIDQRLIIWEFSPQEVSLVPVRSFFTSVPDVQGMRVSLKDSELALYSVLIFGIGVQLFQLKISVF